MGTHGISIDFDGCADLIAHCPCPDEPEQAMVWLEKAYNCLFTGNPETIAIKVDPDDPDKKEYSSGELLEKSPTFASIKKKLESLTKEDSVKLYLGSNRQSREVDIAMKKDKNQPLNAKACTMVLERILQLAYTQTGPNIDFKENVLLELLDQDYKISRRAGVKTLLTKNGVIVENTKFVMLLQQMHDIARTSSKTPIVFTFMDDKEEITQRAHQFFKDNPLLIPEGLTLRIEQSFTFDSKNTTYEYPQLEGQGKTLKTEEIKDIYSAAKESLHSCQSFTGTLAQKMVGGWPRPSDGVDTQKYSQTIINKVLEKYPMETILKTMQDAIDTPDLSKLKTVLPFLVEHQKIDAQQQAEILEIPSAKEDPELMK